MRSQERFLEIALENAARRAEGPVAPQVPYVEPRPLRKQRRRQTG